MLLTHCYATEWQLQPRADKLHNGGAGINLYTWRAATLGCHRDSVPCRIRLIDRNVFCRPLEEICVPEMNAMYRRLDDKGVAGFHFVVCPSSICLRSVNNMTA